MFDYTVSRFRADVRNGPFIFPGGGEMYFLCSDGGILCHKCAYEERGNIIRAIHGANNDGGWRVVAVGNTYNEESAAPDDRTCDHCGKDIDPDPDAAPME